jgi:MFS family permease
MGWEQEDGRVEAGRFRVEPYRWVVLAVVMLVNLTIQTLWISYAPITNDAAAFYGVSDLAIGLLPMTFMIAFIPLSIPAAWLIDTRGFRPAVGLGAVLIAVFGITRGLAGTSYGLVLASTIGLALAQPLLLNAWTKVAANWFAVDERATAVGLTTVSNLVGTAVGMVLTPVLALSMSISTVQLLYGGLAAVSAVLFLLLARERPATPPCAPGEEARALMLDGLRHALTVRPFLLYLVVVFLGMGVFNGLNTWIEPILGPRGFSTTDAGLVGAVFLVSGIVGALVLPPISDRRHQRQRFLLICMLGALPGLAGVAFAPSFELLLTSAFVLGFFLVPASPIGMQYSAEVTFPTPEGTSNGLIQLFGQASVVLVYAMDVLKTPEGSFTPALLLCLAAVALNVLLITRLRDPAPTGLAATPT